MKCQWAPPEKLMHALNPDSLKSMQQEQSRRRPRKLPRSPGSSHSDSGRSSERPYLSNTKRISCRLSVQGRLSSLIFLVAFCLL